MSDPDSSTLRRWLTRAVALRCELAEARVDATTRFHSLGLNSLRASQMIAALSRKLGRRLSPTLVWEYPTINALAAHLAGEPAAPTRRRDSLDAERDVALEPVAIIGMACRLPGAPDLPGFWRLLEDGRSAIGDVPAARGWEESLRARGVAAEDRAVVRRGGFLERVDGFDPAFFGLSPREAIAMDPQQRLMLELAWEALEDACVAPGALSGSRTGVFAGSIWSEYESLLYRGGPAELGPYTVTGSHGSIIANRLSYTLGLRGPSLTLDSACSSGLVVVHLACESLRRGESSLALAGAVNLTLLPDSALAVHRFGALSPDGCCYTFDARANGYVRGEGGGVVVLKTLARALADGDPVRAVILGSAVNNDGASNGLTAPSGSAQREVLRAAYRRAGAQPRDVQYVEAHGTGTPLGDPIEAGALGEVLGAVASRRAPLLVGSAKTNVGHLEGAAGVVGLIKTTLAIQRRRVPPSLNFETPNQHIPLAALGLEIPTSARAWPEPTRPLLAGVSSFGLGGTNSHVVLREWPGPAPQGPPSTIATPAPRVDVSAAPGVVFVFPGQGAQWPGMARRLLHEEPVFRSTLRRCDQHIRRFAGWSLLRELTAAPARSRLADIRVSLPAIISIDIAVAAWWRAVGLEPAAVVGHSTGEIAAAHVAGALSLEDTMRTICAYGELVGRFSGRGAMAYVGLSWDACGDVLADAALEGPVYRAIQDSVEGTVVAGEPAAIEALIERLGARDVFARPVRMNVAPHSPMVDSVRDELMTSLRELSPRRARVPLISEVTGAEARGESLDAAHWVRNFGDPAFFSRAIDTLITRGHRVFLDVGPHPITQHAIETNLRRAGLDPGREDGGLVLSSLRREVDGEAALRESAAILESRGRALDLHGEEDRCWLLPVSARSPAALAALTGRYAAWLRDGAAGASARDLAYTASLGRDALSDRLTAVGRTREELADALEFAAAEGGDRVGRGGPPRVVFVFSGQGARWWGVGRQLLETEPSFRAEVERCDAIAAARAPGSLLTELRRPASSSRLRESELSQAALLAVQLGLVALLRRWGVRPDAVLGQSLGEVTAACVAGALTLEEAVALAVRRGQVLASARASGGSMAWVGLPPAEVRRLIARHEPEVSIAAVNSPASVLLSGGPGLRELVAELEARELPCRRLDVDYASHSPRMRPYAAELERGLAGLTPRAERVPIFSSVTGRRIAGDELDAAYWGRNLQEPVALADAVASCFADGHRLFLEVAPHPAVTMSVTQCLEPEQERGWAMHTLRRDCDERGELLRAVGALWSRGVAVALEELFPRGGRWVSLPSYAWQRERCWVEEVAPRPARSTRDEHPLLGTPWRSALHPDERTWEQPALTEAVPEAGEHGLDDEAIAPGGLLLALALAAGAEVIEGGRVELSELRFERVMPVAGVDVQVAIRSARERSDLVIASRPTAPSAGEAAWTRRCSARVEATREAPGERRSLEALRERCPTTIDAALHYARVSAQGVEYGPRLRTVSSLRLGDGEALARVRVDPERAASCRGVALHPALLDGCLQVAMAVVLARATERVIPVSLARARVFASAPERVWAHARTRDDGRVDISILDEEGRPVASLEGLRCAAASGAGDPYADCGYQLEWRPQARAESADARDDAGAWIVVGDGGETCAALAKTLRRRGLPCASLGLDQLDQLDTVTRRLDAATRGVIFCAGLDAAPLRTVDDLRAALREGAWGAIELARALVERARRDPPQLFVVTRGAQVVDGELAAPAWAPIWGMARTLALEHPELECARIDLAPAPLPDECEQLVDELLAADDERELALRERGRFVARLARGRLAPSGAALTVRADATYWITGGLGGLGLELARWLAKRGAGHLVLTSRRGPDESARAVIEAIEATGSKVHVMTGDVSRADEVSRVLATLRDALPPLRGVVHTAAVVRDRTLARVEEPDFWAPLEPKVIGAWNLHRATRDLALDFFALYSSQVAALGALGQAVYGAGNAFLDALARSRVAAGLPGTSVQWGTFAGVGMTTALADQGARLSALGFAAFSPAEAGELLGRALAQPQPVIGVARLSLRRWIEAHPQASGSPRLAELLQERSSSTGASSEGRARVAELMAASADEQRARAESLVVELLSRVLRIPPARIDRGEPFSSVGLDSLMSLELRGRLERALDLRLPPTLCFTYPTVMSLAEHLLTRLRSASAPEREDAPDDEEFGDDDDDDDDDVLAAFDATMRSLDEGVIE